MPIWKRSFRARPHGATPGSDEPDNRVFWDEAIAGIDQAIVPDGTQLADKRESMLWGFVNTFHAQAQRHHGKSYIKTMHPKGTKEQHISTQKGNGATPDPSQEPCILPPSPLQTTNKEVYKSKKEDARQRESSIHAMRRGAAHL